MAKRRIGILTSGGDCPGLNATIRGVAKACYEKFGTDGVEIVGIQNGYYGLINNIARDMKPSEFSGILTQGGTILGTKRQPFKMISSIGEDNVDKVKAMKDTYKKQKLDCLLTLGGNGTHKTANLLSQEGLNIIGLPKTIDNDIFGTDVTFGFHTAVDVATDVIDRLHTTAASHSRILMVEIMGNKAGWLTLYSGIAGGADAIIIPEIPYDIDKICEAMQERADNGHNFSIVAVAEGAFDKAEAKMKKKERAAARAAAGITTATNRIAGQIQKATGIETRVCVPGHMLRGGSPSAYDRILATKFGVRAAQLISDEKYGYSVALIKSVIGENRLEDVAGKTKFVNPDGSYVVTAKSLGVSFGD
ncbi:MAG: 6-phosphofructokinase [Huintestinicola sp.]